MDQPILFFDGVCVLCSSSVEFVFRMDRKRKFLYAPLLEDKTRPIDETNTGFYGRETANRVHAELRKVGGVTVPREFVFMDRAAVGLGAVFLKLNAKLNWFRIFQETIRDFDVDAMRKRQAKALKQVRLDGG